MQSYSNNRTMFKLRQAQRSRQVRLEVHLPAPPEAKMAQNDAGGPSLSTSGDVLTFSKSEGQYSEPMGLHSQYPGFHPSLNLSFA